MGRDKFATCWVFGEQTIQELHLIFGKVMAWQLHICIIICLFFYPLTELLQSFVQTVVFVCTFNIYNIRVTLIRIIWISNGKIISILNPIYIIRIRVYKIFRLHLKRS